MGVFRRRASDSWPEYSEEATPLSPATGEKFDASERRRLQQQDQQRQQGSGTHPGRGDRQRVPVLQ